MVVPGEPERSTDRGTPLSQASSSAREATATGLQSSIDEETNKSPDHQENVVTQTHSSTAISNISSNNDHSSSSKNNNNNSSSSSSSSNNKIRCPLPQPSMMPNDSHLRKDSSPDRTDQQPDDAGECFPVKTNISRPNITAGLEQFASPHIGHQMEILDLGIDAIKEPSSKAQKIDGSCSENLLELSEDDIENGAPGNHEAKPTPICEEQDRDNGLFSNEEIANHQVYPQDTYSFLSLHGPFDQPIFFGMGIMVSFFQLSLVFMMLLSVLHPDWGTKHDDNPADGVLSNIVAGNASPVVQATQFLAILSYILFADASILDITAAVEAFPNFSKVANGDKVKCMVFSSMVRFLQGFLAMFAAFLLIITSNTAVEIVLNFSAVVSKQLNFK
eukprot:jgi/Psemu1/51879/gm1.51879_g